MSKDRGEKRNLFEKLQIYSVSGISFLGDQRHCQAHGPRPDSTQYLVLMTSSEHSTLYFSHLVIASLNSAENRQGVRKLGPHEAPPPF
jgi:hypothetical protein